jgi:hypothetical protein
MGYPDVWTGDYGYDNFSNDFPNDYWDNSPYDSFDDFSYDPYNFDEYVLGYPGTWGDDGNLPEFGLEPVDPSGENQDSGGLWAALSAALAAALFGPLGSLANALGDINLGRDTGEGDSQDKQGTWWDAFCSGFNNSWQAFKDFAGFANGDVRDLGGDALDAFKEFCVGVALGLGGVGPGEKPPYRANEAHNPNNSRKTPEPPDAQGVYDKAIRDTKGRYWGQGANGEIYRFSSDNAGGYHFSGMTGGSNGIRLSDIPIDIRRLFGRVKR